MNPTQVISHWASDRIQTIAASPVKDVNIISNQKDDHSVLITYCLGVIIVGFCIILFDVEGIALLLEALGFPVSKWAEDRKGTLKTEHKYFGSLLHTSFFTLRHHRAWHSLSRSAVKRGHAQDIVNDSAGPSWLNIERAKAAGHKCQHQSNPQLFSGAASGARNIWHHAEGPLLFLEALHVTTTQWVNAVINSSAGHWHPANNTVPWRQNTQTHQLLQMTGNMRCSDVLQPRNPAQQPPATVNVTQGHI